MLSPKTHIRHNALELQLAEIRTQKPKLGEDEYNKKLDHPSFNWPFSIRVKKEINY
jgi:hypothetical protein